VPRVTSAALVLLILIAASPNAASPAPRPAAKDSAAAPGSGAGFRGSSTPAFASPARQREPGAAGGPGVGQTPSSANPGARPGTRTSTMPRPEDVPLYWRTRAERSGYHITPDYDETMRYLRQIEGGSEWVKLISYGRSGQGRELPLVIVSKDRAFTPEAARATGKTIVLIQNGIHSGEIEGKDASLALIRDIAALRTREDLLDHVILLILPIFSVDAHERSSPWNRINQNGPDRMGWRFTPIGLNLNRDYLKVETPEMRSLIASVFTQWWPDILVDNHTTDGADFRHDISYAMNFGPDVPEPLARWVTSSFEGRIVPRLAEMGHLPAPYLSFKNGGDPSSGVDLTDSSPRFSTGYAPIQCRAGLLVETHMLKPYETRVRATYDLMVALIEDLNAHPGELRRAVTASESLVVARAHARRAEDRRVVLSVHSTDKATPFAFKGFVRRMEPSDIAGAPVPRYSQAPLDTIIPIFRDLVPTLTVTEPAGYLVPQEWIKVQDRLDVHGVHYRRFARAWSDTVEVPRLIEWSEAPATFEGHHNLSVARVALERRLRSYRAGDLWVPLDQRAALVAMHLLEAQAPDGLVYWNAFDTVLELKEYAEDYVMEPIAKKMMVERPDVAKEFRARLAADTAFAKNPAARLDFFYRRSQWADPEANLVPVARALRPPPESSLQP
jgi:murein tripeptide amidase MpaA